MRLLLRGWRRFNKVPADGIIKNVQVCAGKVTVCVGDDPGLVTFSPGDEPGMVTV